MDAFTSKLFFGNPAAVCPLNHWLDEGLMRLIAAENNLSETAFFVKKDDHYQLRWFTPKIEIDLCGHATLASAFVVFEYLDDRQDRLEFETKCGRLSVEKGEDGLLSMDFPAWEPKPMQMAERIADALGGEPVEMFSTRDVVAVYETGDEVVALEPDMRKLAKCEGMGFIATAPGKDYDFISRFFAPAAGVPEDPVTGSAHCSLTPYWSERLGKRNLHAFQASERGGELFCEMKDGRVGISGQAVCYLKGTITL